MVRSWKSWTWPFIRRKSRRLRSSGLSSSFLNHAVFSSRVAAEVHSLGAYAPGCPQATLALPRSEPQSGRQEGSATARGCRGLLPISWSSDNGSHLVVHSVDEGSGGSSSIGTYLSQVAENSAGVRYPRELCGRSVLYSPFQSAPNARACGSLSNSSRSRNSSRTLLWNDSA